MTTSFSSSFIDGFDNNNKKQNNNIVYSQNSMNSNSENYDVAKKSHFKSDRLAQAESEMYYDSINTVNPGHFDIETINECSKDISNYYKPSEPFDNTAYLTDLIVDDRIRKNHDEWVNEVTPWAGTASIVGASEFSAGDYISFVGLRRPRGVQQDDQWQITEVDEEQLAENNKRFML